MEQTPSNVEVSSLPKLLEHGWSVSLSVASDDAQAAKDTFELYVTLLEEHNIPYTFTDKK